MGSDDDGRAQPVEFEEQAEQALRHRRIDVAGRLVGKQDLRPVDQRPRDRGALLVVTAYDVGGKLTEEFPMGVHLDNAKPVVEYLDGWKCDISKCRKEADLPKEAYDYIKYIEKKVGCPIKYVSVGAEREDYLVMNK